jgi:hypothetical protein
MYIHTNINSKIPYKKLINNLSFLKSTTTNNINLLSTKIINN